MYSIQGTGRSKRHQSYQIVWEFSWFNWKEMSQRDVSKASVRCIDLSEKLLSYRDKNWKRI